MSLEEERRCKEELMVRLKLVYGSNSKLFGNRSDKRDHFAAHFTPLRYCYFSGGETRGEAEMGVQTFGKATQRHRSRVPRGLCALHHWQKAGCLRPLKSRSEGKDEED